MKIAIATTFDARDVANWSGTPFYMAKAFEESGDEISHIGNLKRQVPPFFKIKQARKKFACDQRERPRFNVYAAQHYSRQANKQLLQMNVDAIIAPQINPICYLETKKPLVLLTDG